MHRLAVRKHRGGHGHTRPHRQRLECHLILDILAPEQAIDHPARQCVFHGLFLNANMLRPDGKQAWAAFLNGASEAQFSIGRLKPISLNR